METIGPDATLFKPGDEVYYAVSLDPAEIDAGKIRTTAFEVLTPLNADNMRKAHTMVEQGNAIGRVVLSDWTA